MDRKLRYRELGDLPKNTASKWKCWDSNLGNLAPESVFLTIIPYYSPTNRVFKGSLSLIFIS